jgi:hypothetical protein
MEYARAPGGSSGGVPDYTYEEISAGIILGFGFRLAEKKTIETTWVWGNVRAHVYGRIPGLSVLDPNEV